MRDPEELYQRIVEQQLALLQQPKQEEQPPLKKTGWLIPLVAGLAYANSRNNTTGALKALLAGIGTASALSQPAQAKPDEKMLEFRRKVLEDLRQSADTIRTIRERHKMSQLTEELLGGSLSPEEYMASMASLGELDQAASILNRMTEMTVLPNGKAIIAYPGGVKSVVNLYDPNDTADLAVAAAALKQSGNKALAEDIQRIIRQGADALPPGRYRATERGLELVEPFNAVEAAPVREGTPDFYTVDENGNLQVPDVPGGLAVAENGNLQVPDVPGGLAVAEEEQSQAPTLVPEAVNLGPVKLKAANVVTEDKPAWKPVYKNGVLTEVKFAPVGTPLSELEKEGGWNIGKPPPGWDQPKLLEGRVKAAKRAAELWRQIVRMLFKPDGTLNERLVAGLVGFTNNPLPSWIGNPELPLTPEAEHFLALARAFILNIVYAKSGKQVAERELEQWLNTLLPNAIQSTPKAAWDKLKAFETQMLLPPLQEGDVGLEAYFEKWNSPLDEIRPADVPSLGVGGVLRNVLPSPVNKAFRPLSEVPGMPATPSPLEQLRAIFGQDQDYLEQKLKARRQRRR